MRDPGRPAQPAARADLRPRGRRRRPRSSRRGLPAGPGAASGKIYLNADRAGGRGRQGREGPARPQRDLARGPPRHERRRRHPDRARRRVSPRRARRPADGQGLRRRRGDAADRLPDAGPSRSTARRSRKATASRIDGSTGEVYRRPDHDRAVARSSQVLIDKTTEAAQTAEKSTAASTQLMKWCRQVPQAAASAPTPTSPSRPTNAVAFGAEGIGLCRTEHMFFEAIASTPCAR